MRFCLKVAILGPKCYILSMETVNPLVFNCNDLVYRRVEKLVGKGEYASAMLQVLTDEKALQRKRRLKILPFTVHDYEQDHPKVEVEVEGDAPGETETVTQSVEIQEMMKCRKLMKDLAYTIRDIRKLGIEVDVLEGIDNPSLLDIYRMSGTCNN